ncbi:methyltransferase domain-containing protein [Aureibacillus halotolerans]|uniref:Methyltransferase family protein n=1 Tax=Aureibacillus halotolerans TaxID=1508390 RepID=A0A4R6UCP3_9BACI|nr:methyltransferase domain-containing protein [Aureibacillus halotolerans]TDQ42809.1 hypothetical protein EV213_101238 [Aureibacillus halotolerans]
MTFDYIDYWERNYKDGGTSGSGSYGVLADFKAEVVNTFIKDYNVQKVVEFGCGDGHQLQKMNYQHYLGLDVASSAIQRCASLFKDDPTKSFMLYKPGAFSNQGFFQADMTVCLDVLYHITDDHDFEMTLKDIFACSGDLVVLYTKLTDGTEEEVVPTIRDRDILAHLRSHSSFTILEIIPQRFKDQSSADFIILQRKE